DPSCAIHLIDQPKKAGVKKLVTPSSRGADKPAEAPLEMQHYQEAKKAADDHLRTSFLNHSIVRPGHLTNGEKTHKITAASHIGHSGKISRKDVAQVLVDCLQPAIAENKTFEILGGDTATELALQKL